MLSKDVCQACFRLNNKQWRKKHERQWNEDNIVVCPNTVAFMKEIINPPSHLEGGLAWWKKSNEQNRGVKTPTDKEAPKFCPYQMEHIICYEPKEDDKKEKE
jgi:hypothetical protein